MTQSRVAVEQCRRRSLFVVEVGEQVALERLECIRDGSPSFAAVIVCQGSGGSFDRVEVVRDRAVLGP
jgi:hypothetical protein